MTKTNDCVNLNNINSLLFVPAIKEKFYNKIFTLKGSNKPNGIIFDLEDSVDIKSKKSARDILLKFINNSNNRNKLFGQYTTLIRINPFSSKFFKDDINLVKKIQPNILMLAKIETVDEIKIYKKIYRQIFVVVETLKGISNLEKILQEMRNTDLFAIGYEDLSSELLMERPKNLNSLNPLSHLLLDSVITARRFNVPMIDAVSRLFKTQTDLQELKKECLYTTELGLIGKVAIHPNQVTTINKIFQQKKKKEKQRAHKIITNFDNLTDGSFVFVDENNEMIDTPSYKMAKKLL